MSIRLCAALLGALSLAACTIAWQGNFSYSYGAGTRCAITMDWCIIELPQVGQLGVKADGGIGTEYTGVAVRLAPRPGATAGWSAPEVRVVDIESKSVRQVASLATHRVSGDSIGGEPGPGRVFGASHSQSDFALRPRIKRFELRFPDVRSGDTLVQVPSVQVEDGPRFPMPIPWFLTGH
jgi:hypothetical protein